MSQPKFCTNCGNPSTPGTKFCSNCGAKLQQPPPPQQIQITYQEAEETITTLVYSADAVTPYKYNNEITQPLPEDLNTIKSTMKVTDKILQAFPSLLNQDWIGYTPYQRTKKYLEDGDIESLLAAKEKDAPYNI